MRFAHMKRILGLDRFRLRGLSGIGAHSNRAEPEVVTAKRGSTLLHYHVVERCCRPRASVPKM
jgi:hypothetical protein